MKKAINIDKALRHPTPEIMQTITAEIEAAEGRAYERTLTAREIIDSLTRLERRLNIPRKYMVGIKVKIDVNAQKFPSAYKYTPMSTVFFAEYRKSGWFLTSVQRRSCGSKEYQITLTPEAENAILDLNYRIF